ncbi:hypothetical protein [Pseudocitrobacter sp. RIT415]|uniref:hypothetical protein n=1 Tax=Pseudocitrobacter sp. RIT415 TaxID=2202163 RepID=UPI001314DBB7|nr:hypothetical protein [Pseudocitrobacter sp. RIT 415]
MINHYIDIALDYSLTGWLVAIKFAVTIILALSTLELIKSMIRAGFKRRRKPKRRSKNH